jgi:hypothetical protein
MQNLTDRTDRYLAFLRFSLEEGRPVPASVRDIDWHDFYDFSKKQSIPGIIFRGIERIDASLRPDEALLFRWYSMVEKIRKRNIIVNHEAAAVSRLFEKAGFYTCLLKGQGNTLLYPTPSIRTSGDIDLWVYPRQLVPTQIEAAKALTLRYVRSIYPKAAPQYHHVDCKIGTKTPVEIHFTPSFFNAPFTNRRLQRYYEEEATRQFSHTTDLPDNAGKIQMPTNDFNRIFQLSHIMHHFFHEGIGLRQLVDYYYLLKQDITDEEKKREAQLLRLFGMSRFASALMYVMQTTLGLEAQYLLAKPDERQGRYLLNEVILSGNFGKTDDRYSHHIHNKVQLFFILTARVVRSSWAYPAESLSRPIFLLWHQWWKWNLKKKENALS